MPKISVLMSVYNTNNQYLKDAIESVLTQTFTDFEFIIVDDHTCEENQKLLLEYRDKDPRIVLIHNDENMGLTRSLNRGIEVAQGEFIARMDSDDICVNNRLERQLEFMINNRDVLAVGGLAQILGTNKIAMKPVNDFGVLRMRMIFFDCAMIHPTAFINLELLKRHGITYDESVRKSQDYMLWADCMMKGRIAVLEEIVLQYRIHPGQITKTCSNDQKECSIFIQEKIMKTYFGEPIKSEAKELHYDIVFGKINMRIKQLEDHFAWLLEINKSKGTFDEKAFQKECYYMWFLMLMKATLYHKDISWIKSKMSLKVLAHVSFWPYYLRNML